MRKRDYVPVLFYCGYTAKMAAANYNKPKPMDPVWYRQGCYLRVSCECGRTIVEQLGPFAKARGVSFDTRADELIYRLRCGGCGRRPSAEVTRHKNGN